MRKQVFGAILRCLQILQIIRYRNILRFRSTKEVLRDGVGVIAERDLNGTLKSVYITIIASTLICLMLSHKGEKFFCRPSLGLEVVIIRGRSSGVHLGIR